VITDTRQVGQSIRAAKTGEMIASYLRSRIVRGELAEGDCLPSEVELMRQFDVSRPTLREAFRILETESLIVIRRGSRGARITAPRVEVAARYVGLLMQTSGTTLADVHEARSLIEPAAVALLARRRTPQDVADLAACIDELEAMVGSSRVPADIAAWTRGAQRFHELIMERAGNRTLAIQSMVLREVVETHLLLATRNSADAVAAVSGFSKLTRSFRKLLRFVQAGDDVGAQQHWQAHMEVVGLSLLPDRLKSATVLDLFS
jgi:DNA-binding FadR family transcriptional regulator